MVVVASFLILLAVLLALETLFRELSVTRLAGIVAGKLLQLLMPESRSAEVVDSSHILSMPLYNK